MEAKHYYILHVDSAHSLKDTQLFGKQSPFVQLSIGKSTHEQVRTTVKVKAGCNCVWNETIFFEANFDVEFLLVEVKTESDLIGLGRFNSNKVSDVSNMVELQLTDRRGKKAGNLLCSIQKFYGDLNQLHAYTQLLREGQARLGPPVVPGVTAAANVLLQSVQRGPVATPVPQGGVVQQPVVTIVGGGFQPTAPQLLALPDRGALPPLPPNWEERRDPSSGTLYYVNHDTRKTCWERPCVAAHTPLPPSATPLSLQQTQQQSAPLHKVLQPGVEEADESAGEGSVQTIAAIITCISPPSEGPVSRGSEGEEDSESTLPQPASSPLPPHWEERVDRATNKSYFLNHLTKTTSWHRPPPEEQEAIDPTLPENPQKIQPQFFSEPLPLPSDWEERVGPGGKLYYVNHASQTTCWERPLP